MMSETEFNTTVETYMDTLYRTALNYLRDSGAAEDVCQEVFLRLYRRSPSFDSEEHKRYWLLHVTVNECRRVLASPWHKMSYLEDLPDLPGPAEPGEENVFRAVMDLPRKYRIVLHLYYFEGYSTKEIAGLLSRKPATVRSQLDRGRELLKQRLLEEEHV